MEGGEKKKEKDWLIPYSMTRHSTLIVNNLLSDMLHTAHGAIGR